jgi:hypothetical protein
VVASHGIPSVRPLRATVIALLADKLRLGDFDLVYASGLYDYLEVRSAARLTRYLFGLTRAGGRVVIANYAHAMPDRGYMEAFMDWHLVYRSADEMLALASEIAERELGSARTYCDTSGNIVYLELVRSCRLSRPNLL